MPKIVDEAFEVGYKAGRAAADFAASLRQVNATLTANTTGMARAYAAPATGDHPRTYSLTASGPKGELFLVTDDESGIQIGHAKKIGGPLTAPVMCRQHSYEIAQHIYDIECACGHKISDCVVANP